MANQRHRPSDRILTTRECRRKCHREDDVHNRAVPVPRYKESVGSGPFRAGLSIGPDGPWDCSSSRIIIIPFFPVGKIILIHNYGYLYCKACYSLPYDGLMPIVPKICLKATACPIAESLATLVGGTTATTLLGYSVSNAIR